MTPEYLKKFGANFVYRLPSIENVTLDLIQKVDWPENSRAVIFQFETGTENAYEVLWRNIGDRYFARLYYYADKGEIRPETESSGSTTIQRHSFRDQAEMEAFYVSTIEEFFWKPWGKHLNKFRSEEEARKIIVSQAKEDLANGSVLAHSVDGEVVSFLAHTSVYEPVIEKDVNWILWVWIKDGIQKEERTRIKTDFSEFLKNTGANNIYVAPTEPFNSRPNKYWQRLGFKLGCIGITIK